MPTAAGLWRSASQPSLEYGSGAEQIARAAFLQVQNNLAAQCGFIETLWTSRDQDWAELRGYPYVATTIKQPMKDSFYLGMQPSLVAGENAKFERWPAVTVRAGNKDPSRSEFQPDQYDEYQVQLIVEVLAMAGPFQKNPVDDRATSDAADRQYQRLSDAVVACINQDRSLGGTCASIQNAPQMTPSIPYVRVANKDGTTSRGWIVYQAQEMTWLVTSLSRVPGL